VSSGATEYIFSGHVQGVGFRMTMQRLARHHGVSGWVRNEPDGSVRSIIGGALDVQKRLLDDLDAALPGLIHAQATHPLTDATELPLPFEIAP
jgi:acylphosphatase